MYSYIKGIITQVNPNHIVIENNQIGYLIKVSNPYSFKLEELITLHIYQSVKEDAIDLYGFKTPEERDIFIKLISVKGLGPKGALVILTSPISDIIDNIEKANTKFFNKFPGIGSKLSQQIILDLAGKLNQENKTIKNDVYDKTVLALKSMGYKNDEIKKATANYDFNSGKSMNDIIRDMLKKLSL